MISDGGGSDGKDAPPALTSSVPRGLAALPEAAAAQDPGFPAPYCSGPAASVVSCWVRATLVLGRCF